MGMYTELYIRCSLKSDTPKCVIETLRAMTDGTAETTPFGDGRRPYMFRTSSFYHHPSPVSRMDYIDYTDQWYLFVRCDLKNYENEIEDFLCWIKPFIDAIPGEYIGHTFYEEDDIPTNLIYGEGYLECQ